MTNFATDLLADLIRRKHECLIELRDLARQQDSLIHGDNMNQLLQLLGVKQRLLEILQQVERDLTPFREEDPDTRTWRSSADRERCAQQLHLCEALLAEIVQQEKQSETQLRLRRDETASQLQGFHSAHAARGAYTSCDVATSGHLDLTSEH